MEKNIKLYPWFRIASDIQAWIPVFFLYMSQYVDLEQVIQLSAVYYGSVFLLEVPSGYFSDRVGRRITLGLSALSMIVAHSMFLMGSGFMVFATAQFMLAAGIAFQSGTDTALHYDSLAALSRQDEYEAKEARAEKFGLSSLAVATLLGGVLGSIDLKYAYMLSLCGAVLTLVLVCQFKEPAKKANSTDSFFKTLLGCIGNLRQPVLAWIFCSMIVMYALEHVPFEFYQPYIRLLDLKNFSSLGDSSSIISGVVISLSMFGGAIGAAVSVRLRNAMGLVGILALAAVIQLSIVSVLSSVLHVAALMIVFVRNFPMALIHAPVNSAIAPRIGSEQRATYLSMQGLSQRVFFAILLISISISVGGVEDVDWTALSGILRMCLLVGFLGLLPLFLLGPKIRKLL